MVGLTPPPHGAWKDNNGKPIYFDGIDNTAYILGKAKHSARTVDGSTSTAKRCGAVRADVAGDPANPEEASTSRGRTSSPSKDTWLGPTQNSGGIAARCTT